MSRYTITESVNRRGGTEHVHDFEDLEKHHPSSGREAGRQYATIDGKLEEVRHLSDGRTLIKKDFILGQDTPGPVSIPAPIAGYVHRTNDPWNTVKIYDRPYVPGGDAVLLGQVLHMGRGTSPPEGARIEYGQPLGRMADTGTPGSIHAHVEVDHAQFQRYVRDIDRGAIAPGVTAPALDGVLRRGEQGEDVKHLQEALNRHGAQLPTNGNFGPQTEAAVRDFQRTQGLELVDGIAGPHTLKALGVAPPQTPGAARSAPGMAQATPAAPQPATATAATPFRDSPLSALISGGEGGYGSYNRGRAGDANGGQIDFSALTVGEVMRRQRLHETNPGSPDELFAVGKYQMVPATMREAVARLGIDPSEQLTPQLQERLFNDYLIDEKRPEVRDYITGQNTDEAARSNAQLALSREFASVANPATGRSYYDGDSGGNAASITAAQTASALDQMRDSYQRNVQSGMSPNEAYRDVMTGDRHSGYPSALGGTLREGRGAPDDVRELQTALNRHGAKLPVTGTFDTETTDALKTFQRSKQLDDDGIAGARTLKALGIGQPTQAAPTQTRTDDAGAPARAAQAAGQIEAQPRTHTTAEAARAPLLSDSGHPDNPMYQQALAELEKFSPTSAFNNREKLERGAAMMVYEARISGLSRIDHIVPSTDGSRLIAVEGELRDPAQRRVVAGTAQAIGQSVEQTTRALAQDVPAPTPLAATPDPVEQTRMRPMAH
ncbi:peptidoglycan hydrolase-like protein with peptidoglycan-binding domain [Xanthomonas arboricola]|uniref:peptidoglycan-binding protein n=1 Tax=Xanthomonas sp. 3793 TaxID=3035312 RepID=UPI0021671B7B|nr:peptidoglycan-binding protein [Xanthomonas sp. 3793]MCS3748585.1 peptidoglycan hydrolase-like protein with peptidoglycan-binding domain [Xanthomonas sp. 3793]